jgi:hypothetical protein
LVPPEFFLLKISSYVKEYLAAAFDWELLFLISIVSIYSYTFLMSCNKSKLLFQSAMLNKLITFWMNYSEIIRFPMLEKMLGRKVEKLCVLSYRMYLKFIDKNIWEGDNSWRS